MPELDRVRRDWRSRGEAAHEQTAESGAPHGDLPFLESKR